MSILIEISEAVQNGKSKLIKELVPQALEQGISAQKILNDGLLDGMGIIGEKFKKDEVFVPEVLVAARAMNTGSALLKPHLTVEGAQAKGRVCLGTVKGDLHDIGKNLVRMMMEGKGLEVIDIGVDVDASKFIETAVENNCSIIACSSLLTTTMGAMKDVVACAEESGIRDKVKIMIGGAPITQQFCDTIGADAYTPDAITAAERAVELITA